MLEGVFNSNLIVEGVSYIKLCQAHNLLNTQVKANMIAEYQVV